MFPIRGHSYLPNDQDFSHISKKHPAETVSQWVECIENGRKTPSPFTVREMEYDDFFDIYNAHGEHFLKSPKPPMRIKSARMTSVDTRFPEVRVRYSYSGNWHSIQVLKANHAGSSTVTFNKLYSGRLPLQPNKAADLASLVNCTKTQEGHSFLTNILNISPANVFDTIERVARASREDREDDT